MLIGLVNGLAEVTLTDVGVSQLIEEKIVNLKRDGRVSWVLVSWQRLGVRGCHTTLIFLIRRHLWRDDKFLRGRLL